MPRTRWTALPALAYLLALAPSVGGAASVWTASSSEKIRPEAAARSTSSASLGAARNEFEAFQIVVTGPARGVSASASPLTGASVLAAPRLYREELIAVAKPSSTDGAAGRFPDALVPDVDELVGEKRNAFPFDVPAGESRAIWVELHVHSDAPAGSYAGAVAVQLVDGGGAAQAVSVPVTLTVWDFALPSTSSLQNAYALTYGGLTRLHGVEHGPALTAIQKRYAQLALDHRMSISTVWDDGVPGWEHFDAEYGPLLDGTAPTRLRGAKLTSLQAGARLDSSAEHGDWARHFRARGWFDRLFQYTCDEPPLACSWGDVAPRAAAAKAGDAEFRTLVTTDLEDARRHGVDGLVDVLAPLLNFMEDRSPDDGRPGPEGERAPTYAPFVASGPRKALWLYQSCMSHGCGGEVELGSPTAKEAYFVGWPSYAIDASAVRARAMEWLSFRYGATGELYYSTTEAYYAKDPWTDQYVYAGNGDGTLFYPGTPARIGGATDVPVASLRMKMIREGLEDYEYLKLLADLGGADEAQAVAKSLFPHAWSAEQKPEDLMAAREAIARRILELTKKTVPPAGVSIPPASPSMGVAGPTATAVVATVSGTGCSASSGGADGLASFLLLPLALLALRRRRAP